MVVTVTAGYAGHTPRLQVLARTGRVPGRHTESIGSPTMEDDGPVEPDHPADDPGVTDRPAAPARQHRARRCFRIDRGQDSPYRQKN
jgi:hypothetical protein